MPDQRSQKSWRRRLRLTVRGLMVLVLTLGGWLGGMAHSAQVQRDAVAAIRKAGGRVWYEWEYKEGVSSSYYWRGEPWSQKWLVDRIGIDYFGHVVAVRHGGWIDHSGVFSDKDMLAISRLKRLVEVRLYSSSVTDAGLAH